MTNKELEMIVDNAMDLSMVYDNIAENLSWRIDEGDVDEEYDVLYEKAVKIVNAKLGGTQ